jgi:hypothetical protein
MLPTARSQNLTWAGRDPNAATSVAEESECCNRDSNQGSYMAK